MQARWRDLVQELADTSVETLRYKQGYIQALVDILDIKPSEEAK